MKIAVYSLFRDNEGSYLDNYFHRLMAQSFPKDRLRLYLVEGDSKDATYNHLLQNANWAVKRNLRTQVYTTTTGSPRYGSVVDQGRFDALNATANVALGAIAEDKWADYVMLIESDLLYGPDMIETLAEFVLMSQPRVAVAPSIYAGDNFYDVWGFIHQDGTPVGPEYQVQKVVWPMQSVGSCVLYPAYPIYEGWRFHKQCMRTLCKEFTEQYGVRFFWKDSVKVCHPI